MPSFIESPFRYPGAKTRLLSSLSAHLGRVREHAEPFVGGGSTALYATGFNTEAKLLVNDIDPWVSAFWSIFDKGTDRDFTKLYFLLSHAPNVELFQQLKEQESADFVDQAYRALFFNRTTFSGMLDSGPIGGYSQEGDYKINCRYNAESLIQRIEEIRFSLHGRVKVTNLHFRDFIPSLPPDTFIYADPPYFEQGNGLYRHGMTPDEHRELADLLHKHGGPWVLSYDNSDFIKDLYASCEIVPISASYTVSNKMKKTELVITRKAA